MIPDVELDLQVAVDQAAGIYLPEEKELSHWITKALVKSGYDKSNASISLRVVEEGEITGLNQTYRNMSKPTNVLSFPYDALPDVDLNFLGDIVVCAAVVDKEAKEQSKTFEQHWAHIIIHGLLHLLGYDHLEEDQAEKMESLEIDILSTLGIPNPYGELNTP